MSSYYPSFTYMGKNSLKDKNLIVVHFESGDDGEVNTFLDMEPVYTENYNGTKRIDYGAKYSDVAVIRISVMKANGCDFTVSEVRDFLRWTTGSRQISYLDLVDGEIVKFSFLGRITSVYQQKLDARTVGFVIEHTSVSPYAYSSPQYASCTFGQALVTDENGVLYKDGGTLLLNEDGSLSNGTNAVFDITDDGVVYLDNSVTVSINNDSDELYSYVYMDTTFTNTNSDHIIIKNQTLYDESDETDGLTEITGMSKNEIIKLSSEQFITSNITGKVFGDRFNFVWPKLIPGDNDFVISGTGEGTVEFAYRYPVKIGDCAIDIDVSDGGFCGDCSSNSSSGTSSGPVTWNDILNKPTTISGYGITDAYTIAEVNSKLNNVNMSIDEAELNEMLEDVLSE